jgi:hypothetical protein
MTIPLVRVDGDFAVARPIPWDEEDSLRAHVDRVIDSLTAQSAVVEVDARVNLDEGNVHFSVVMAGEDEEEADRSAREAIGASIRECEGRHFQLLPAEEEAELSRNVPARSGLLTPLWRLRKLSVERLTTD